MIGGRWDSGRASGPPIIHSLVFPSKLVHKTCITREVINLPPPEIHELYTPPPRPTATHPN